MSVRGGHSAQWMLPLFLAVLSPCWAQQSRACVTSCLVYWPPITPAGTGTCVRQADMCGLTQLLWAISGLVGLGKAAAQHCGAVQSSAPLVPATVGLSLCNLVAHKVTHALLGAMQAAVFVAPAGDWQGRVVCLP